MTTEYPKSEGLARTTLALLLLALLIGGSFWVMRFFLGAMIWAAMIAVATWPILLKVQSLFRGSRTLAVVVMTTMLLLLLILPLSLFVATVYERSGEIATGIRSLSSLTVIPPPDWVRNLPIVGKTIATQWQSVAALGVSAFVAPYAGKAMGWFASFAGTIGTMVVQFLLTAFIAAFLYLHGEKAAAWLCLFARRIAGRAGEDALFLAGKTIRAVALGVVGTAIIQAILVGVGLAVAGLPATGILTAVAFMLCLAQVGPAPVILPAAGWLFWNGDPVWGTVLVVWTVFLATIDNVIRPFLMKMGVDLPMLLVFAGVTGGLLAFGVIGLFVGPVVLAVSYTLLDAWVVGDVAQENPDNEMEGGRTS